MALALNRENYLLHKLHSLTGVVPVGYYLAQHLLLNSFTVVSPEKFNSVLQFFEGIPWFVLTALEVFAIWIPLLFHAVYGMFIIRRAQPNYIGEKYGWSQNRMYTFQRYSGVFILVFLMYHVYTTTITKYMTGSIESISYAAWQHKLTDHYYFFFVFYLLGIIASTYHLAYGIWNFCIRWGITISDHAQRQVQKLSLGVFVVLTAVGWLALAGFLMHKPTTTTSVARPAVTRLASR